MLEMTVSIPGLDKFNAALADLSKGVYFQKAKAELLPQVGERLKARAKQLVPKAFGTLEKSIDYKVQGDSVLVGVLRDARNPGSTTGTMRYGMDVEFGSGAHFPPPMALEPWMRQKGMSGSPWGVAINISKKGTPAQPFLRPALVQTVPDIEKLTRLSYTNALNDFARRAGGGLLGRIGDFFRGFFG